MSGWWSNHAGVGSVYRRLSVKWCPSAPLRNHASLTISHFNGQTYTILHNTSYRRIINKTIQPVKYQSERWTALYDEQSKVLNEQKDGKVLSFLPRENKLLLGSGEYKKVK